MAFPKELSLPPENHHTVPCPVSSHKHCHISCIPYTRNQRPSGCWAATLLTPGPQSDEGMGRPETHSLKNGGG